MTSEVFTIAAAIMALLAGWACYAAFRLGEQHGRKLGRDEQWVNDFFERTSADLARRDKRGRFKSKEVRP